MSLLYFEVSAFNRGGLFQELFKWAQIANSTAQPLTIGGFAVYVVPLAGGSPGSLGLLVSRARRPGIEALVDFRKGAKLDPTQVEDRRGMRGMRGGRGVAVGGGAGVVGIIVVLLITLLGGENIDLSALQSLDGVIAGGQQQQGEVHRRVQDRRGRGAEPRLPLDRDREQHPGLLEPARSTGIARP